MNDIRRLVLLAFVVAACTTTAPGARPSTTTAGPLPSPSAPGRGILLPSFDAPPHPGIPWACAGIGLLDAVLHGDAADPGTTWLLSQGSHRIELVWPSGYRARFVPSLEVVDPSGTVVGREGDRVNGACVTADPGVLEMMAPFEIAPAATGSPTSSRRVDERRRLALAAPS
jgi:hypothetical protein